MSELPRSGHVQGGKLMICACIGDLHLDERSPRYEHALDMIKRVTRDAIEHGAKHVFFLGDIFEGAPSPREYRTFIDILLDLVKRGCFVGICRGNHEDYEALSFFEALHPMIRVAWDSTRRLEFDDFSILPPARFSVLMIPYPTRHKAPYENLEDGGTIAGGMRAAADRIGGWIQNAVDEYGAVIVLGHFTIEGMTTRDTDFELHQSNEVVVPLTAFAPAALTIVGHIHREQELTPTVIVAGSLYRCSFAEAEDEKGYVLVSANHYGVRWERRRVGARLMLVYSVELDAITSDWIAGVAARAEKETAEVKITVLMDEEQAPRYTRSAFAPIEAVAPHVVIERQVRPTQRVRAPEISPVMDDSAQLIAWLRATEQEVSFERLERLMKKFEEISG